MDWQIERNDVAVTGDFEAFVRATVLFEIWGPELDVERIQVELSRVRPGRPLHRCTVEVKLAGVGTFVGGTIGTDPLDTVKRAALAVGASASPQVSLGTVAFGITAKTTRTRTVLITAVDSRPRPQATPIAAVIQTPAAVVRPTMLSSD